MRTEIKTSCLKRLKRIEGQIRGLAGMVADDRYCIDVVTQIAAAKAALRRVEEEILRDHVAHCVEHAITSGDKADQRRKIAELMDVVGRAERFGGESVVNARVTAAVSNPERCRGAILKIRSLLNLPTTNKDGGKQCIKPNPKYAASASAPKRPGRSAGVVVRALGDAARPLASPDLHPAGSLMDSRSPWLIRGSTCGQMQAKPRRRF